jgi:hypothetical protein
MTDVFDMEEQQKQDVAEQKRLRQRRYNDIKKAGELVEVRRLLWWILSEAGVLHSPFAGESTQQTAFNCGKQDLGLKYLIEINNANPKLFPQMQREQLSEVNSKVKKQGDEQNG